MWLLSAQRTRKWIELDDEPTPRGLMALNGGDALLGAVRACEAWDVRSIVSLVLVLASFGLSVGCSCNTSPPGGGVYGGRDAGPVAQNGDGSVNGNGDASGRRDRPAALIGLKVRSGSIVLKNSSG